MSPRERLDAALRFELPDRLPTMGGWIGGAANLAALAELSLADYLSDPRAGVIRAHRRLGVDGMVPPITPTSFEEVRWGSVEESHFLDVEAEALEAAAEALPETEAEVLATFDPAAEEAIFRAWHRDATENWGGIVPIPNFWDLGGHFPLYNRFGYVAFLGACALYPEHVQRLWWAKSLVSRERAKILARLKDELDLLPLHFCGEDLCNNQGPMVSPEFLRAHYFPTVRMSIEPLLEAGFTLVHHCDGDVRPLVDDFLDLGFSGFQGFQQECGVEIADLRRKRTILGGPPLILAGMSVTRTLPFGRSDDVRAEVESFIRDTDGGRGMILFTSNVTGVEVPVENLRAGYSHRQLG